MKHNLNESYLQSLTEQQRIDEMKEWSASEWQQYYCPNGTMTLEEFRQKLYNKVDEMILKNMVVIISNSVWDKIDEYARALTRYPITNKRGELYTC